MAKITNREELEAWLKNQPREVAVAIAARAALRVLPLFPSHSLPFVSVLNGGASVDMSPMPLFRAAAIAWLALRRAGAGGGLRTRISATLSSVSDNRLRRAIADAHPNHGLRIVATNLIDAYRFLLMLFLGDPGDRSEPALTSTLHSCSALAFYAPVGDWKGFDAAIEAIRHDADHLSSSPTSFLDVPLWHVRTPEWVDVFLNDLEPSQRYVAGDWVVWLDWYRAILNGQPTPGGENLDIYRVALDSEADWDEGPKHVNGLIRKKLGEIEAWSVFVEEKLFATDTADAELIRAPDRRLSESQGALEGSVVDGESFDFGPQSAVGIAFAAGADGRVDVVAGAGAHDVLRDRDTVDGHAEVWRLFDELVALHRSGSEGLNNGNGTVAALAEFLLKALGDTLDHIRPGLLIPRGEALRQILIAQEARDELSDLPPVTDKMMQGLKAAVSGYNIFVGTDPELARRDEARLGPDARKNLVSPREAREAVRSAVELGAATEAAKDAIDEEAATAPAVPDIENRSSRRLTETLRNLGRAMLRAWQSAERFAKEHPIASTALGPAILGIGAWVVKYSLFLERLFEGYPGMSAAIRALAQTIGMLRM